MSGEHDDIDKSFPYFEEHYFSGWLIQFKAMLREHDCDEIIKTPIPKDVDANGNPILMNARERQVLFENSGPIKKRTRLSTTQGS
jgi:hypothetical protein